MAFPSQSALELKYVSDVCLALVGRVVRVSAVSICLYLPLFYFEAIKHLHCLTLKHGNQQREYSETAV